MGVNTSNFPEEVWDGHAPTLSDPKFDKTDFQISDQHAAEIRAIEQFLKAYADLLRLIGDADTILGVNHAGTALEYKQLVAGSNISINHSSGAISISSSGGGGDTSNSAETDSDISIGQPLYIKANAHVDLAQADAQATTRVAGLAKTDAAATFAPDYATDGQIVLSDWTAVIGTTSLTPGATYFLSAASPGMLTVTAPTSGFVVPVGRAINTTTFDIEISPPVRL